MQQLVWPHRFVCDVRGQARPRCRPMSVGEPDLRRNWTRLFEASPLTKKGVASLGSSGSLFSLIEGGIGRV